MALDRTSYLAQLVDLLTPDTTNITEINNMFYGKN